MKLFKHLLTLSLILTNAFIFSSEPFSKKAKLDAQTEQQLQDVMRWLSQVNVSSNEPQSQQEVPSETKLTNMIKALKKDDKKFVTLQLILRELLASPASKFITETEKLASKYPEVASFNGHTDTVYSVAWNNNGTYAATGSEDNTIKIWDMRNPTSSQQPVATLTTNGRPANLFWTKDDKYLITRVRNANNYEIEIVIIDVQNKANPEMIAKLAGQTSNIDITTIAISPDGNYLIGDSYIQPSQLIVWDISNKQNPQQKPIITLPGHDDPVTTLAWSHNGNYILSGTFNAMGPDYTIKLWRFTEKPTPTLQLIKDLEADSNKVNEIAWSHNDNFALSGAANSKIALYDIKNKLQPNLKPISALTLNRPISTVSWSPNDNFAISGSKNGDVHLNILKNKDQFKSMLIGQNIDKSTSTGAGPARAVAINQMAWNPKNDYALSVGDYTTVKLWDLSPFTGSLASALTKLPNSKEGVFAFLLMDAVLKHKQSHKTPFRIFDPELIHIFKELPLIIQKHLLKRIM